MIGSLPMLRASCRPLFVFVAVAALHGSTARAPMASVDATSTALVRAMPDAAIDPEIPMVSGNPIAVVLLDRLSETRNRPLFSPSRRPLVPPATLAIATPVARAPQALPVQSPPGVALFGIVVGAQDARAFIAMGTMDQIIVVRPGDDVLGWRVSAITQRNLVLSHAEQSATFTLFSLDSVSQPPRDVAASNPQATRASDMPHPRVRVR